MHSSAKNATKHNPEIGGRAEEDALYGAEYWPSACNVEKLNKKNLPCGHGYIVHTVLHGVARRGAVGVWLNDFFCKFAVDGIACNQTNQANDESVHISFLNLITQNYDFSERHICIFLHN